MKKAVSRTISPVRKVLAVLWLALGIGIAIASVVDIAEPYWRPSWFAVGAVAAVLACICSLILFKGGGKLLGIAIAAIIYTVLHLPCRAFTANAT